MMAPSSVRPSLDVVKTGSADLLILALVEGVDLHGYDLGRRIEQRSHGTLRFTMASLYATLYRLEERGHIRGRWVERAGQRRRRYYRITPAGRTLLAEHRDQWGRFLSVLIDVAGVTPVPIP